MPNPPIACSVLGLGKLGSPLAAVLAAAGHHVVGVDVNPELVSALASGKAPVLEPDLQESIDAGRSRLRATTDVDVAVRESDVSLVVVPTPSDPDGAFSNDFVLAAVSAIGTALRTKSGYHVVSITSTVMPGSTGGPIRDALEHAAGRAIGDGIGLCYSPEFIALGSVVRDLRHPDLVLIGESDPRAGDLLAAVYARVVKSRPEIRRMSWVEAELTKLAVNTFVTTKISYANMLSELCDRLPGADVDVVTAAVGADSRIGVKYLRGATAYGGPCFPRDNVALSRLAQELGIGADIAEATDAVNRRQVARLVGLAQRLLPPGGTVAVLGLAYKPGTEVCEESFGVALARALVETGTPVVAHDPLVDADRCGPGIGGTARAADAIEVADLVVLATPCPEFRALEGAPEWATRPRVLIDCWRLLDADRLGPGVTVVHPGRGDDLAALEGAIRRSVS